ncbi:MAG: MarR family transcriptional regulator [Desulfobacterales bacterium]|nr:MarR family transcriptional regulator [Desulfobacterales bacterium]
MRKDKNESITVDSSDRIREVVQLMRKIMQGDELYTKELNKEYMVSAPQLSCVLALYEHGPLPPSQLARHIMVNSSTVTGIIDRLEQKGYVERTRTSPDRRVITLTLTEKGKDLARVAPPPFQKKIMEGLKKLSGSELEQVVQSLTTLAYMLDVHDLDIE